MAGRRHYGPYLCCFLLANVLSLHSETPTPSHQSTNHEHHTRYHYMGPWPCRGAAPQLGSPTPWPGLSSEVWGASWVHQSQSEHHHFRMSASYLPALFIGIVSPVLCDIHGLKKHIPYTSPTSCTFVKENHQQHTAETSLPLASFLCFAFLSDFLCAWRQASAHGPRQAWTQSGWRGRKEPTQDRMIRPVRVKGEGRQKERKVDLAAQCTTRK